MATRSPAAAAIPSATGPALCDEPRTCAAARDPVLGGRVERCVTCGLHRTAAEPEFAYESSYFTDEGEGGYAFESPYSLDRDAARFLPELTRLGGLPRHGSVLDIGCATGVFLEMAAAAGWDVSGVEVAEYAASAAERRIGRRVPGSLDELPEGTVYDVVTLHHVLEHIHDPVPFLRDHVRPRVGGVLLVEVPNFASLPARVHGLRWRDLRLDQHVFHYEPRTLEDVLRRSGFEPMATYTLWDPLWTSRTALETSGMLLSALLGSASGRTDDGAPRDVTPLARYRRPRGIKRLAGGGSRLLFRPLITSLEARLLAPRLVVEAVLQGSGSPSDGTNG